MQNGQEVGIWRKRLVAWQYWDATTNDVLLIWCRMENKFRNLKPITGCSAHRLYNKCFVSTGLLLVSQESDSLFYDAETLQQMFCYRAGRPSATAQQRDTGPCISIRQNVRLRRCPRWPIKSDSYGRGKAETEKMTRTLKNMSEGRRIDKESSCDQSRNYRPSVRHQFRCSLIVLHKEGKLFFPFYIVFLSLSKRGFLDWFIGNTWCCY
jgi:hypothetical protein